MIRSHRVRANGLSHHVLEWSGDDGRSSNEPAVVLLHGFMDTARSWDLVVPHLVRGGRRVFAPDLRGFGDTDRVPEGGYYHFADYVADVEGIVDELCGDQPFHLIGHSMGGTVATLYAGARPERVARLALLEGLGIRDNPPSAAPLRMHRWLEDLRSHRLRDVARGPRSMEQAFQSLQGNHPTVPAEVLQSRLPHLIDRAPDGSLVWRFDPLHRTTSPAVFRTEIHLEFIARITCPVLIVGGGPRGFHVPDEDARIATFVNAARTEIDDAGHMMHWTRPTQLANLLLGFLG
ncbi:alpha/beta hydrolase [Pendulispora rubella]|uniref:Alpha/beta hydrolase n=1 Tax=Pendulispora rubella TaxID=2741070 RepID=A0ABZ2L6C0_9BACT